MERWSNKKITVEDIKSSNNEGFLINVILDQQFDYWYDPCGKSGHDLSRSLTERSRVAMERLKNLKWHGELVEKQTPLDEIVDAVKGP